MGAKILMGVMVAPLYDQDSFRVRDNVIDPSGIDAVFDVGDSAKNADWTQLVDTLFRVRFLIQQTDAAANVIANLATEFALQWQNTTQATGWSSVFGGMNNHVGMSLSSGFADHDNIVTSRLGSGSLVTGDGLETDTITDTVTFTTEALSETELEVALSLASANVNNGDLIELRWVWSELDESPPATVLDAYTNIPIITVDKPAPTGNPWNHYHQQMN